MDVKQSFSSNAKQSFSSKELFLSLSMFLVGFLYWNLIQIWSLGAGVTVFSLIITAVTTVYLSASGFKQNKSSIICNGLIYLGALNFLFFDNSIEKVLNMLWLMFLFVYWVALFTDRTLGKSISIYTVGDWIRQIVITPFANFSSLFAILIYRKKGGKTGKNVISALVGLLIFLPLLVLVIALLSSVDAGFENIFSSFFAFEFYRLPLYVKDFLLGIPVAMYLCGLIIGNSLNRHATCEKEKIDKLGKKLAFAPNATINAALAAFCAIYLIFFAVQVVNLIGNIGGLADNMTYAQYARKGFFQLCLVAGINLGVCAVTYIVVKDRASKVFRTLVAFMSAATILLGAVAMSKMVLYIKYYGLTQLRVYSSWFIILLALIFAVVLVRQIKTFNGMRLIAVIFTICFMVLTFGNIDGQIAKYNLTRYEAGTLEMMDEETLSNLSYAAMPHIYKAYENADDKETKEILYYAAIGGHGEEQGEPESWKGFNLQKYKGKALQEDIRNEKVSKSKPF